jgi:triosephosphate isomerase
MSAMDRAGRGPVVAGNWKMNLLRQEAQDYCATLLRLLSGYERGEVRIILFPSHPLVPVLAEALAGSGVVWGGQDLHPEEGGAHTGDVSGPQLADAGCDWVLCGHSERRRDHDESDGLVARKAVSALTHGLQPMICLGESLEERERGQTEEVLARQLVATLGVIEDQLGQGGDPSPGFALAYEPVWAIGTGRTATPQTAQEAHAFLRRLLGERIGESTAEQIPILYGGSVKQENCRQLYASPDIDGFLVGGASLDPHSFFQIIRGCRESGPAA